MHRMHTQRARRVTSATVALLALLTGSLGAGRASAEESPAPAAKPTPATRDIAYPVHGFSLDVPKGWTLDPYSGFTLELKREHARISLNVDAPAHPEGDAKPRPEPEKVLKAYERRVRADEGPNADVTWRPWPMVGAQAAGLLVRKHASGVRILGLGLRGDDPDHGFDVEVSLREEGASLLPEVRELLSTMDLRPFEHPHRFVEHDAGWTLDPGYRPTLVQRRGTGVAFTGHVPKHPGLVTSYWVRPRTRVKGAPIGLEALARSVVPDIADELEDVVLTGGDGPVEQIADAYGRLVLRGTPSSTFGGHVLIEARIKGDLEALAVTWRKEPEPKLPAPAPDGSVWIGTDFKTPDHLVSRLATLRERIDPGPRKGTKPSKRVDRFPRADAPPLRFALPEGWRVLAPSSPMRVAEVFVPGEPDVVGAVFWFGADQGGSLEANLERWRRQITPSEGAPAEPAPGVVHAGALTVTTLDRSGSYAGRPRPGRPATGPRTGMRMLASYLATPQGPMMIKLGAPEAAIATLKPAHDAWVASMHLALAKAATK